MASPPLLGNPLVGRIVDRFLQFRKYPFLRIGSAPPACNFALPAAGRAKKENTRNFKDDLPTKEMKEMAMFDHITEISSTLMDAGELDVYSIPKEVWDPASCLDRFC